MFTLKCFYCFLSFLTNVSVHSMLKVTQSIVPAVFMPSFLSALSTHRLLH